MEELTRLQTDCEKVINNLHAKRHKIFTRLENLDKEAAGRERRRKEVMLREMKLVLALLSETEKNVVTEFKAEAMDMVSLVSKVGESFRELRDEIAIAAMKNETGKVSKWTEDLETLKKELAEVDVDFLEKCLDIQLHVNSSPPEYEAVRSQYRNLIFHSAGSLSPRNFLAQLDNVNVVGTGGLDSIQFSVFHVDRTALCQEFLLKRLMVTVSGKTTDGQSLVHEQSSVFEKISKQEGRLLPPASQSAVGQVLVRVRLQKNPVEISVKLFDCNIVGSPRHIDFHLPRDSPGASDQSLAVFDNRVPGYEDCDNSDLRSLDITGRGIQSHLNASLRRTGRLSKMSTLTEMVEDVGESSRVEVAKARPRLKPAAPKSILKQQTLMDPPDSASSSPFNPKFKGTMKLPPDEIDDAILKLSEGTYQARDSTIIDKSLNKTTLMPETAEEDDDPHLLLNESKAPSPTSLAKTIIEDSCWGEEGAGDDAQSATADLNVSVLPGSVSRLEQSVWEEEEIVRFNFCLGHLEEVGRIQPELTGVSSSRGGQQTLLCPDSVALLPSHDLLMVSEPDRDRIGVYSANTLKFASWFQYPGNNRKKRSFVKPTSLLAIGDILVITDSEEILVFSIADLACTLVFSKRGSFHGLSSSTEEEGKKFFTVSTEEQKSFLLSFQKNEGTNWKICQKIPVDDEQKTSSNIQFLIEKDNKIYMTDKASHHLIQVDLKTGDKKVGGYLGHNPGQIYQPGDLLTDDLGSLLLCDSGNFRLLVFSEKMEFIKDMSMNTSYQQRPHSMLRQGRFVFVVYQGQDQDQDQGQGQDQDQDQNQDILHPAVVKFKLSVAGLQSEDTTPSGSDRE